jgi:hypothetical protein
MTGALLLTIKQVTERLWGKYDRTKRERTLNFLKCQNVKMFKDGRNWYIRASDMREFEGGDDE